jgi:anti-anti-sigma factor
MQVNSVDNVLNGSQPNLMAFSVQSRSEEEFAVLELSGPLTLSPGLASLRETARKLLGGPKLSGLILQVSGVTAADSAGLGELTIIYTFASQRSCPLRLVGATPSLRKMLEMTRLEDLFHPVDTVVMAKKQMRA